MGWRGAAAVLMAAAVTACGTAAPVPPQAQIARVTAPNSPTVLFTDDPAALAVATSGALFTSAPLAVLAAVDDPAAQNTAAEAARRIGVPMLLTPPDDGDPAGVTPELARLGVVTVLAVGAPAVRWAGVAGRPKAVTAEADLPPVIAPSARLTVHVFTDGAPTQLASVTTAAASGAQVTTVPGGDPRRAPVPDPGSQQVLALGTGFGSQALFADRLAVTATGTQLPGGGQVLFPGRRIVALYGSPNTRSLGALGAQDLPASVARVTALATQYRPLVDEPVVPAFELVATAADVAPGADGDYSAELPPAALQPWVDAAKAADGYVVLDLQPGRADLLDQAKRYADLLTLPYVGLALDPAWRLGPTERPRNRAGSVGVDEINRVVAWLADLTRAAKLPQKLLVIHQATPTTINGRERLDTSRDELAVVIGSDGVGTPAEKTALWDTLHAGAPNGIRWGWKNFVDEDRPVFTPEQTAPIPPTPPAYISYQ